MRRNNKNYEKLRRIFELYSIYLNNYIFENQNSHSPDADAIFVIANGDDKLGNILAKTISCQIMSEELFYEEQPYIVCGLTSRSLLLAQLKSIKYKDSSFSIDSSLNLPVVVADFGLLEVFDFVPKQPAFNSQ